MFCPLHVHAKKRQIWEPQLFSQGVDLFALKFYLDWVVLCQPFLASEC